ncbi:glycoside hydrolase family 2 TIM barrel-domain containing protein [Butyrivibrio sp.]|uniref:glycoside hydrolase family 2 protein n=1 Tax=Butyrivibrio sp. TaxID=28121 RepID=UPI0025BD1AE7|nr:glycoside hydrolase family 2 TIM barrel-domain containing protein [Butyrivibrio sp.]MBQ9304552.1 glycoside hydrolase family 2 protein [Butyrivibrio sp.]
MSDKIYLNDGWEFTENFTDKLHDISYNKNLEKVRIPHTVKELPLHYFDESMYQMLSGYRYILKPDESWDWKRIILTFEGAAHEAVVYINGKEMCRHSCGYTAFSLDITEEISLDKDNVIVVKLDSRESLNVPPFGHVIDYLTFGGIYRDVYIQVKEPAYIKDVFAKPEVAAVYSAEETEVVPKSIGANLSSVVTVAGTDEQSGFVIRQSLCMWHMRQNKNQYKYKQVVYDKASENNYSREAVLGDEAISVNSDKTELSFHLLPVTVWDVTNPVLYLLKTELIRGDKVFDTKYTKVGFRNIQFKKEGFFLNGRKFLLRGLNRHQSYPYVGYAMPKSMQILDADILKTELSVNAVRTSHYPQSQSFINRCDEIGLLVFMEFPGWQHIGDAQWKEQAYVNEQEMILQYRNHPSIFIWGIRINESVDDDEFYTKTNEIAHNLDNTRPTGGVRASKKSHLLEDVYTYNDFSHDGKRPGCDKKQTVTSDMEKGYLITEFNGHMYPTKAFDDEEQRSEHALRHVRVLDAVAGEPDIAGSFGWCMFDYNTHKDFGSGDKICYHGVMDPFRNPKLAASVYASQGDETVVLEVSSSMDIGEHPECIRGNTYIFTNADSVKMYKNDVFIKEYKAENSDFKNLKHNPILIDDFIGDQIKDSGAYSERKSELIKRCLNDAAVHGMNNLSFATKMAALKLVTIYRMNFNDAVELYNKYIGDWGGKSTVFKFEAVKNGKVVKTVVKEPAGNVKLDVVCDHTRLLEKRSYDVALVRVRAVDERGNVLPYFNDVVKFKTEGDIELIGPDTVCMQGGMTGTYVRTVGRSGRGRLVISTSKEHNCKETLEFKIEIGKREVTEDE